MLGSKTYILFAVVAIGLAASEADFYHYLPHPTLTVSDFKFVTITITVTANEIFPSSATSTNIQAPNSTTSTVVVASSISAVTVATAAVGSSNNDYMNVVNKWRSALGLPLLRQDSTLEANAQKTCDESRGQLKHELNPGSLAQVLAPGTMDNFEDIYVGGWLCEVSTFAALKDVCPSMSQGWDYEGQTGHADVLDSTSYTRIGCAGANNVVGCDLA